jgi:hypothetical protein
MPVLAVMHSTLLSPHISLLFGNHLFAVLCFLTWQVTCDFDSTSRDTFTSSGGTHNDEMCNMWVMRLPGCVELAL